MKNAFLISIVLLILLGCSGSSDYKEHFSKNKVEFEMMRDYIDSLFINSQSIDEKSILSCEPKFSLDTAESDTGFVELVHKFYCDSNLNETMNSLEINLIEVQHNNLCTYESHLNRISFRLTHIDPEIHFIYDYCGGTFDYKSEIFEEHQIDNNWYYTVLKD
jgi:hypothetical protein